jgi:TRAP transporter 4TM/12TM fusion protein
MKKWKTAFTNATRTESALIALALVYVGFHLVNLFVAFGPMGAKIVHICMGIVVLTLDLMRRHPGPRMKIVAVLVCVSVIPAAVYFFSDQIGVLTRYGFASSPDMLAGAVLVFWMFVLTGFYFGTPFAVVGIVFFVYAYLGSYLPAPLTAPSSDLLRVTSKLTVGSLGDVVELSVTVIFLMLLYGSFLQASGAGAFIWRIAGNLARRLGGGTGALTVVSSGLVGTFSGAGAAGVGITGPIAIPLMKRDGYTAEQAAAIEAIASTGGQIAPPVLGMVAFLMADFLGIPYARIVLASIVPSILFYLGLLLFVVLIYRKNGGTGALVEGEGHPDANHGWLKVSISFNFPILMIVALIIGGMSVQLAVFWSIVSIVVLALIFRLERDPKVWIRAVLDAAVNGAALGMASGVLDVVMASLDITQLGMIVGFIVSEIGGASVLANFLLVLVASYIMGMGMPGVAVYAVLAVTLAPVLINLGADPMVAHFLIMYMTILSNFTPPVAPTLMLTARIAGANYMRSGLEAMKAGAGSMILPFFLFSYPALLLYNASLYSVLEAIGVTALCIFLMTVSLIGWFGRPISMIERLILAIAPIVVWSTGFAGARLVYWGTVVGCCAAFIWLVFAALRMRQKPIAEMSMNPEGI